MNTIPAKDLKRHGISAIEKLLPHGPVHVIKRNQPICVVIAEEEYRQLTQAAASPANSHTVMEWFALSASGSATKEEIDVRLADERNSWNQP